MRRLLHVDHSHITTLTLRARQTEDAAEYHRENDQYENIENPVKEDLTQSARLREPLQTFIAQTIPNEHHALDDKHDDTHGDHHKDKI